MDKKVFISYSRSDRDKVMKFVRLIEEETGAACWIDLTGIESGSQFEETIIKAIDQAEVLLFMMSDQSLSSSWIKREVYYAEGEGKRVVPVSLDGKPLRGWAKFHLGHIDYIDASSKEQVDKLLFNLGSWLNASPETGSRPDPVPPSRRKYPWLIPVGVGVVVLAAFFLLFWRIVPRTETTLSTNPAEQTSVPMSMEPPSSPNVGVSDEHEWVDLGTGVKWATCNIGASFPGDYGTHFAWGETTVKTDYSWTSYRFRVSGNSPASVQFSKYNTKVEMGAVDQNTRLVRADDVAHEMWGGDWRMPTKKEYEDLLSSCDVSWTSRNGHDGCLFTSRKTGGQIFLPASGYRMADSLSHAGSYGHYWSSSLNEQEPGIAWYLFLDSSGARLGDRYRFAGRSVRAVRP